MGRSKVADHTNAVIKADKLNEPVPSAVFLPPASRGGKNVVYALEKMDEHPVSVEQQIVRIQQEADPIGYLIAIVTGQPVPTYTVLKDGSVKVEYHSLPPDSPVRERAAKHLADKVLPRMSVTRKHRYVDPQTGDESEWEATIGEAAERAEED